MVKGMAQALLVHCSEHCLKECLEHLFPTLILQQV